MSHENVFTNIYESGIWGVGTQDNPKSGGGSNPNVTIPYVEFVQKTISKYGFASVLDVGHGDWAMWRDYKFENVSYLGIDVARNISDTLTLQFGTQKRKFSKFDSNNFSYPPADLLITKEVFQHLSNKDIQSFFDSIQEFKYVIFCNGFYPRSLIFFRLRNMLKIRTRINCIRNNQSPFFYEKFPKNNSDIVSGDFRGIDLEKPLLKNV
jgi:hypothetical protein